MLKLFKAAAIALACFLAPAVALAADAAAASTVINFAPLVNDVLIPAVATVLTVVAGWLATKVAGWLNLKSDQEVRTYLEWALQQAIAYGKAKVPNSLAIDAKSEIVAGAANYAINAVPDALKRFGIDEAGLKRMIEARLDGAAATPAVQP